MTTPTPNTDDFYPLVWHVVRQVPAGHVSTYGQIASMLPPSDGIEPTDFRKLCPKWVGEALNAVSFDDIDGQTVTPGVPWWRIINSKGGISMPRGSNAAHEQRQRLAAEDVQFDARGLVSLDKFGWDGPPSAFIESNGLLSPKPLRKPPDTPRQISLF